MSHILCIDDEGAIRRLLGVILARDGHTMLPAANAREALVQAKAGGVDAVLLDLGLPDRDGLELISPLSRHAPVLVISARSDVQEKVAALDLGAVDYLTKPFDGDELLARLRVALRGAAAHAPAQDVLEHGPLRMDLPHHTVQRDGETVALTPKEFTLLRALIQAGGRIQTHAALLEQGWGKAHRDDVDYLRVGIRALRLKLEADPAQPSLILNEPGIGYKLG